MRITYTNDHFTKALIIQIAIDNDDLTALPIRIPAHPVRQFLSLSQQLFNLAMVAEALELHQTAEDEMDIMEMLDEEEEQVVEELEELEDMEDEDEDEDEDMDDEDEDSDTEEENEEEGEDIAEESEDENEESEVESTTREMVDEDNE